MGVAAKLKTFTDCSETAKNVEFSPSKVFCYNMVFIQIGQFWSFLTLCDFKLCDCIARKILLTINFARLKFVCNLIMRSGSDPHKAHK